MLKKYAYDVNYLLNDEIDFLEEIETSFDGIVWVNDAISETADNFTPIYYHDLWKNAEKISEYIDNALIDLSYGERDIHRILQCGYYQYYIELAYDNEETLKRNIFIGYLNDILNENNIELDSDQENEILYDMEINLNLMDLDTYDELQEKAQEYFDNIILSEDWL